MKNDFIALKGYEGFYEINKKGEVKTINRVLVNSKGVYRNLKPVIRKTFVNNSGYIMVQLNVNGKKQSKLIHRLIAENFIENPLKKSCVNHINANKKDNRIENLEWCTYSENNKHIYTIGNNHKLRMLNDDAVKDIYKNAVIGRKNGNIKEFVNKYNINRSCIHKIIKGITYKNITEKISK